MIDIKFLRENPEAVRENIRKKFQDAKLPMVDEVIEKDAEARAAQTEADAIRSERNKLSKEIGGLMGRMKAAEKQGKTDEAAALSAEVEEIKAKVAAGAARIEELDAIKAEADAIVKKDMMAIPQIISDKVPIGKDDSENVEITKYGDPVVPDFEIPYHTQIMESFDGIDLDSAGRVAGNGFYYLSGDIARLHSAVLSYARDFMIGKGFTYFIPPFMIRP